MHNPLDLEREFQALLISLACPGSARQRLLKINHFLNSLGNDFADYEPYLVELAQRLPDLVRDLNYVGCDPETLRVFFEKVRLLHVHFSSFDGVAGLAEVIETLRHAVSHLYAYAGDIGAALAVLDDKFSQHPLAWLEQSADGQTNCPLFLLQRAHKETKIRGEPFAAQLQNLMTQWSPATRDDANSITVPVIEHAVHNACSHEGSLRRITVSILGQSPNGRDEIHADVAVFGADTDVTAITKVPVAAARRLFTEKYPALAKTFFTGQVVFEATHALHEGNSANLAIAALFYCAALQHTDQREQFRLASTVTLTGDLNEAGEVLPVDGKTLATKVKAAFFSWVECLVVPKSQLREAESAAQELTRQYPHRQLTIIGVGHLREIFYDRRLTKRECAGMAKHLARKAWRKKFTVGGLATTVFLVLVIGKLLYGPIDKNPVSGEFVEESLLIKNKYGEQIDEIRVGPATVRRAKGAANDYELWGLHYVTFFDVDGDGMNEVFWVQWDDEKTKQPGKICCKSVKEDTLRWSIALRRALDFPRKPDIKSDYFYPHYIAAGDFDGDGRGELFVNSSQDFFPALVLKLEAKTGKELGHYVHVGQLGSMKLADLDNDGITEVLLCGVNNAFRKACLVVLDPRFISGHSPLAGDYVLAGYPAGLEKAYILIPRTIVGEAFSEDSKNNIALAIFLQQASRNFFLLIRDASSRNPPLNTKLVDLYGYFGFDLRVQSFGTHDDYDLMAEKLFREGRISRMPDYAYFEEYKKTMMYWNGEGWQKEPVMNRRYWEACKGK
ncbi:MAG: hypothetical protein ONB44_07645 [candidate division KSB1 bacterium]|nr:hypothetical protein [candidate division KSB1 bacterium]MDZ7302000.1 hypothetical protein [candidate division KSB1 bacterium]MDZ7310182.1 hypothetical protein [candidate division KSB1 bacterium]